MKFWAYCISAALAVSISLFLFMGSLISTDGIFKPEQNDIFIDFARLKFDSDTDFKQRSKPKKPPKPEQPKDIQKIQVAKTDQISKPTMKMDIPKLSLSKVNSGGPYLGKGGAAASEDGDALPIIRIEPIMPRKAAMRGIEGWAVVSFDITPEGTVSNIRVVDSSHRKLYDKAAKRALRKWRYKPKVVSGKAVAQLGQKVNFDFKLQK